jgi:hypothetical protein
MSELINQLKRLKPFEEEWNSEMQACVVILPNGYLIRDYDTDTDKYLSTCFVPMKKEDYVEYFI